ncbi:hypothetical protein ACJX0J_032700, partial [Zea mays]
SLFWILQMNLCYLRSQPVQALMLEPPVFLAKCVNIFGTILASKLTPIFVACIFSDVMLIANFLIIGQQLIHLIFLAHFLFLGYMFSLNVKTENRGICSNVKSAICVKEQTILFLYWLIQNMIITFNLLWLEIFLKLLNND